MALISSLALVALLAACGGDDSGDTTGSNETETETETTELTQIPDSGCGSTTLEPPPDPDGVLSELPQGHQDEYAGYTYPVRASAWSDWSPSGDPPYTVGVQWSALNTDFQVEQTEALQQRLDESEDVGEVIFQSTSDSIDVTAQIQQFESLLRQDPDIIIVQPIAAEAFEDQVQRAADQGIPVVVALQHIDSPAAVNVQVNAYQMAAVGASALVRLMDGEGNMLVVHAVPGSAAEVDGMAGLEAVLENCPDIEVAGDVTGNFLDSQAKEETLQYLATNPGELDGVFDINSMATGVMSAIDESGRPMPPVFLRSVDQGGLGYWINNQEDFDAFATGISSRGFGSGNADVAIKMLRGDGVLPNSVLHNVPLITEENLDEWAEPEWDLHQDFDAAIAGPPVWIEEEYMDPLFRSDS